MNNNKLTIYKLNNLNIKQKLIDEGVNQEFIDKHALKFHYFISVILKKKRFYKNKDNEYVKIWCKRLREELGNPTITFEPYNVKHKQKKIYYIIKDFLLDLGVIRTYSNFKGEKGNNSSNESVFYKISDEYLAGGYAQIAYSEKFKEIEKRTKRFKIKNPYTDKLDVSIPDEDYKLIKSKIDNIGLDFNKANKILESAHKDALKLKSKRKGNKIIKRDLSDLQIYSEYRLDLDLIQNQNYFILDAKTKRLYHKYVSLPKLFRCCFIDKTTKMKIDFVELDIANCQPLLAYLAFKKSSALQELDSSTIKYKNLCESGLFYSYFKNKLKIKDISIDETFKQDIFTRIFFNRIEAMNNKYAQEFARLFPQIYRWIVDTKMHDYKEVAYQLQRLEADIIVKNVCPKMASLNCNFFPLHDAVFVQKGFERKALEIINNEFDKNRIVPKIHCKLVE